MSNDLYIYGIRPLSRVRIEEILDAEPGLVTGKVTETTGGVVTIKVIDGESKQNFFVFQGPDHANTRDVPAAVTELLAEPSIRYHLRVADLPPSVERLMAVFVATVAGECGGHCFDTKSRRLVFEGILGDTE